MFSIQLNKGVDYWVLKPMHMYCICVTPLQLYLHLFLLMHFWVLKIWIQAFIVIYKLDRDKREQIFDQNVDKLQNNFCLFVWSTTHVSLLNTQVSL